MEDYFSWTPHNRLGGVFHENRIDTTGPHKGADTFSGLATGEPKNGIGCHSSTMQAVLGMVIGSTKNLADFKNLAIFLPSYLEYAQYSCHLPGTLVAVGSSLYHLRSERPAHPAGPIDADRAFRSISTGICPSTSWRVWLRIDSNRASCGLQQGLQPGHRIGCYK